jgi:hypothetical protein
MRYSKILVHCCRSNGLLEGAVIRDYFTEQSVRSVLANTNGVGWGMSSKITGGGYKLKKTRLCSYFFRPPCMASI